MRWQSHLTSQLPTNLVGRRFNTTHKPVTWWDHIRASAWIPIPRITPELLLLDWTELGSWTYFFFVIVHLFFFFLCFLSFFLSFSLFYSCIINSIITSLLSPFSSSPLFLLLLYYNQFFSLPTALSGPFLSLLSPPILPQTVTTLPLPPTHSPPLITFNGN
jgi:hypothetical protein